MNRRGVLWTAPAKTELIEIIEYKSFSIEDLNKRIDISLFDSANDSVTENSLLLKEIEKWA